MTTYKMVEVQVDLSDFETEALLQELVDRSQAEKSNPEVRSWLLEMLSPELEPQLNALYLLMRNPKDGRDLDQEWWALSRVFDITLGRIL